MLSFVFCLETMVMTALGKGIYLVSYLKLIMSVTFSIRWQHGQLLGVGMLDVFRIALSKVDRLGWASSDNSLSPIMLSPFKK